MVEVRTIVNFFIYISFKNGHFFVDSARNQGRKFWTYLRLTENLVLKVRLLGYIETCKISIL